MATRRLQKEFKDLSENGHDVEVIDDDILHWQVAIHGPADTPYFGGTFVVNIVFPKDYPFEAPKVNFITTIYHLNVERKAGSICIAALKDNWNPTITVAKILDMLIHLLKEPHPSNPLEASLATLYVENKDQYVRNAIACTAKHAM